MTMRISNILAIAGIVLASTVALADTAYVTVGSRVANNNNNGLESLVAGDNVVINSVKGRSYACSYLPEDEKTVDMLSTVLDGNGDPLTAVLCGDSEPIISTVDDNTKDDNRLCFIAPTTGELSMGVGAVTGGSFILASIECLETTLFGGYNTNVSSFVFLELENRTTANVTASITIRQNDGTVVADAVNVNVAPNSRTDFDVHTVAGANQFGSIIVSNTAPFGGLSGRVSSYSSTASGGLSLQGQTTMSGREQQL
jgi:hypothetical protein